MNSDENGHGENSTAQRSPLVGDVGPSSTSPKCQPTNRKESNLGGIEHAVYKRYTSLTGKNHR